MKKLKFVTLAAAVNGLLLASPLAAVAEDTDSQRLEELDQKVKVLERKLEIQDEEAAKKAKENPVIKAGEKGFSLESKDGAFQFKLRGLLHVDYRDFQKKQNAGDTFILRRVRPTFEGTLYDKYDFRFTPDFGGGKTVIQDAYIEARFLPEARVRVGKFKAPVGLERLQSGSDIKFVERGLPTDLAPNRDLGLQLSGDLLQGGLTYAVGYFNGTADGQSSETNASPDVDNNSDKDIAARIFAYPFLNSDNFGLRGIGIGIAATTGDQEGSNTNTLLTTGYKSIGQATFFKYRASASATNTVFADGKHNRIAPQFTYYYGPLGVLGEYTLVEQDVHRINGATNREKGLKHKAWQVAATYLITGEDSSFKGVNPKSPFKVGEAGWGAFELAARYGVLDIDNDAFTGGTDSFANPADSASKATDIGVGVNWYLNRNVKAVLNYDVNKFDGGAAGGGDRPDEKVLFSRLQLAF